ncbi:MAG: pseudouridine synthase [Coriobacteriia bacterium]|nr:pseudouridine synthase [Coriobacteriia bacterium]
MERLQKYLARCGVASRRRSEKLISGGHVTVNGNVVTKLGTKVDANDEVLVDGKSVSLSYDNITIILNKPAGYVSTMDDPQGRACVAELVPIDQYPSLFPVGRLDRLTTGLLLFTTDGELGNKLLHPSHEVNKTYEVVCLGDLKDTSKLESGVVINSGKTAPAIVEIIDKFDYDKYLQLENEFYKNSACDVPFDKSLLDKKFTLVNITIHEGKNRQVRRMFEKVGHPVLLLKRISLDNLKLDNLELGKWRKLDQEEEESLSGYKNSNKV